MQNNQQQSEDNDKLQQQEEDVKEHMKLKDFYEILGVTKESSQEEIKKAYRKLALKFHPDKNKAADAQKVFKKVAQAYDCLSNEEKKAVYDKYGSEEPEQHFQHYRQYYTQDDFDPNDIFKMFFGGNDIFSNVNNGGNVFQFSYSFGGGGHRQTNFNFASQKNKRQPSRNDNQQQQGQQQNQQYQQQQRQQNQISFKQILGFLPLIFLIFSGFFSNLFKEEAPFSLNQSYFYNQKQFTSNLQIPYFTGSTFEKMKFNSKYVKNLEFEIENNFIFNLRNQCFNNEMLKREYQNQAKLSKKQSEIDIYIKKSNSVDMQYCQMYEDLKNRFPDIDIINMKNNSQLTQRIIRIPSGDVLEYKFWHVNQWAHYYKNKKCGKLNPVIYACEGRPTAPINLDLKTGMLNYWNNLALDQAIAYGDYQGEYEYRQLMAKALQRHYNSQFQAENILFTVGGFAGIKSILYTIQKLKPDSSIVTTLPYYPPYHGFQNQMNMIYINTLIDQSLTAELIFQQLKNIDANQIGAFIICSPNNPVGWVINKEEWVKIAKLFKEKFTQSIIILDEAYAEMLFNNQFHVSLISVAPELKDRIILMRSATKGLSASGERMAVLACWNQNYMHRLQEYHFHQTIHAPKSHQYAYSYAMDKLQINDLKKLSDYYEQQVRLVENCLEQNGFKSTNKKKIEGTFYVIGDFSELLGKNIEIDDQQMFPQRKSIIEDDIDIAFFLLENYGLSFSPLSSFGVDDKLGFLRITCSLPKDEQYLLSQRLQLLRQQLNKQKINNIKNNTTINQKPKL